MQQDRFYLFHKQTRFYHTWKGNRKPRKNVIKAFYLLEFRWKKKLQQKEWNYKRKIHEITHLLRKTIKEYKFYVITNPFLCGFVTIIVWEEIFTRKKNQQGSKIGFLCLFSLVSVDIRRICLCIKRENTIYEYYLGTLCGKFRNNQKLTPRRNIILYEVKNKVIRRHHHLSHALIFHVITSFFSSWTSLRVGKKNLCRSQFKKGTLKVNSWKNL